MVWRRFDTVTTFTALATITVTAATFAGCAFLTVFLAYSGLVALRCSVGCDCLLSAFSTDVGCVAIGKSGLATVSSRCAITTLRATTTAFTATFATAFARLTRLA